MRKAVRVALRRAKAKWILMVGIVAGLSACGNWYPNEAAGPTGPNCCFAYDDYPPYTSGYYEPGYPYGYNLSFHQRDGFSGSYRPGFHQGQNDWDSSGVMHWQDNSGRGYDYDHNWSRHHEHESRMEGGGGYRGGREGGAGQNENYGRDTTDAHSQE